MVNFNTSELKVSITRSTANTSTVPLAKESIKKLEDALVFALNRSRDMLVVLAFPGHYLPLEDFKQINEKITSVHCADFLTTLSDLIVIRTNKGNVVTVRISSGSILFAEESTSTVVDMTSPPKKRAAVKSTIAATPTISNNRTATKKRRLSSGDDDDIGELTQECLGLL